MGRGVDLTDYDKHYEDDFTFPLWDLIKKVAEERDISYLSAIQEVVPGYIKTIRYRDVEFEQEHVQKRRQELAELAKKNEKGS
jgi:hypothetical protein